MQDKVEAALEFDGNFFSGNEVSCSTEPTSGSPRLVEIDGISVPPAPVSLEDIDIDPARLGELTLKLGNTVPSFTSKWATNHLRIPSHLVDEVLWQLKDDRLVEILGQAGPLQYRYAITKLGRDLAKQLLEVSGYVGPVPVSVEEYNAMMNWQSDHHADVSFDAVQEALSQLTLPEEVVEVAALAAASGRSLFLFGPAGNGKSSLGHMLHSSFRGNIWIPHCIGVDSHVIRIFDPQCHFSADSEFKNSHEVDQRWLHIRRPFIVAGGEMTIK